MQLGALRRSLDSAARPGSATAVRELSRRLIAEIGSELPFPAEGKTDLRWRVLAMLGGFDLSVAKLVESHFDALAILHEAGLSSHEGVYGVWASKFGGKFLRGECDTRSGRWMIHGDLAFASGAAMIDFALVPVATSKGEILFQIPREALVAEATDSSRWHTPGMYDADTSWVRIEAQLSESEIVGEPGFYLNRPGFWIGGMGVAACWLGGAQAVFTSWQAAARKKEPADVHDQAKRAHCFSTLKACSTQLMATARQLDAGLITGSGMAEALQARHLIDRAANEVIELSLRSLGPMLLVGDAGHSRRALDLQVFTRQCHGDKDLVPLCREIERIMTDETLEREEAWFG